MPKNSRALIRWSKSSWKTELVHNSKTLCNSRTAPCFTRILTFSLVEQVVTLSHQTQVRCTSIKQCSWSRQIQLWSTTSLKHHSLHQVTTVYLAQSRLIQQKHQLLQTISSATSMRKSFSTLVLTQVWLAARILLLLMPWSPHKLQVATLQSSHLTW